MFSKIHKAVMEKIQKQSLVVRLVFKTAFNLKRLYFRINKKALRTGKMPVIDKVFKQIQNNLGGHLELIFNGSSALPEETLTFLRVCTGSAVTNAYGTTETCVSGFYNYFDQKLNSPTQLGWGGKGLEAKLVDRADQCEFTLERDKIGELLIKGPGIAKGYVDGQWG